MKEALAVAVLMIAAVACGGDTSAGTSSDSSQVPAASAAPASPAAVPSPVPAAVIPNLTQNAAMQLYLDQGFACSVVKASEPTWTRHRCSKAAGSGDAAVDLEGPGTGVASLKASMIGMPDVVVQGFLGDSASLPFDGDASSQAQQWVSDNLAKGGGTTVIGKVHLLLLYSPPVASVTLKPAS